MAYSDQATAPGGPPGSPARRRRGEPRVYDFRRPVRLAREHAHLLKVAMETFGRQTTTVLTTSLRTVCQVSDARLEELSYDEYLNSVGPGKVSAVLTLDPLPGKALLALDQAALLTMLDHQLGGPGGDGQPTRGLTDIEQALVRQLLNRFLRELTYALESIARVKPHLLTLEDNAQFVQAAAPTDPVVVAHLDVLVGNSISVLSLCLPYAMLEPALAEIDRTRDDVDRVRARAAASKLTGRRLEDVEVEVGVRFDAFTMASGALADLVVGDVISLQHRTTAPLSITSAASTFAHGIPGSAGAKLAVLVVPPS